MKYKVRYYEDAKVHEKELEASGFYIVSNSGGKTVIFYADTGPKNELHAISDFISVEKI